jgi:hypothetical protein
MAAIGRVSQPHVGGRHEQDRGLGAGGTNDHVGELAVEIVGGRIHRLAGGNHQEAVEARPPVSDLDRHVGHRKLVLEGHSRNQLAVEVVDDDQFHFAVALLRGRDDRDRLLLARLPAQVGGAENGEEVARDVPFSATAELVPLGPPEALVFGAVGEEDDLHVGVASHRHQLEGSRAREAGITVPRVPGAFRTVQLDARRHIGLAIVKQRSPIGEMVVRDPAVGQVERLALEGARVQGHGLVVGGGEGPGEADVLAPQLGIRGMAEAVQVDAGLTFVAQVETDRDVPNGKPRGTRLGHSLDVELAACDEHRKPGGGRAEQGLLVDGSTPEGSLQKVRGRLGGQAARQEPRDEQDRYTVQQRLPCGRGNEAGPSAKLWAMLAEKDVHVGH